MIDLMISKRRKKIRSNFFLLITKLSTIFHWFYCVKMMKIKEIKFASNCVSKNKLFSYAHNNFFFVFGNQSKMRHIFLCSGNIIYKNIVKNQSKKIAIFLLCNIREPQKKCNLAKYHHEIKKRNNFYVYEFSLHDFAFYFSMIHENFSKWFSIRVEHCDCE